jgi:hypothetical protein
MRTPKVMIHACATCVLQKASGIKLNIEPVLNLMVKILGWRVTLICGRVRPNKYEVDAHDTNNLLYILRTYVFATTIYTSYQYIQLWPKKRER